MIRYDEIRDKDKATPITLDTLKMEIQKIAPTWLRRAKGRTDKFRTLNGYTDKPADIWSEIKDVYMRLQANKCAYCERQLEGPQPDQPVPPGGTTGRIEHDIEHFRPKSEVTNWPGEHGPLYDFATGSSFSEGYYLLAYNPFNYAAACKVCNTERKGTYFPIAGKRISGKEAPEELTDEQPYLLYPIGNIDENPETILTFNLLIATPASEDVYSRRRALVTIDLFDLNGRDNLRKDRLLIIRLLYLALEARDDLDKSEEFRKRMKRAIVEMQDSRAPHASCARAFVRMYEADPTAIRGRLDEIFPP